MMMERKAKICLRCKKLRTIKGHGLCDNCYNIEFWKWDSYRTTTTFKKYALNKYSKQTIQSSKEVLTQVKKVPKKKSERTLAMNNADTWFSRYIRLKHSAVVMDNGQPTLVCKCYTCGNIKDIKNIDNGHWIGRENMQTRYHENDCRPQCTHCNQYKGGRQFTFEQHLIADIGESEVEKLKKIARICIPVTAIQLRETAKYYREKVKIIQNKIGVKIW